MATKYWKKVATGMYENKKTQDILKEYSSLLGYRIVIVRNHHKILDNYFKTFNGAVNFKTKYMRTH